VEEIKKDIAYAKEIAESIKNFSWKHGEGGHVSRRIVSLLSDHEDVYSDGFRSVLSWLYYGGESVFIQDANSIIMKTGDLVEVLSYIKEQFPLVNRITSYCRSKTAARKSVEEFQMLKESGLTRIHIGMESGYDPLLKFMRKGVTAAEHIEGGKRIKEAGISLCEYVMPGLGGNRWSNEHAEETARVINQINPDFVRLRSLHVVPDTDLFEMTRKGEFNPLGDEGVLKEIRKFVETLDGIESTIVSDHILNLLEELNGKLPDDKYMLLRIIDNYFSLPGEERLVYRVGRRTGIYRSLDDLSDKSTYHKIRSMIDHYGVRDQEHLDKDLLKLMNRYIQ
jgi:radical SAM superfamily enzyme YgiQ (UPF0313 family)